MFLNELMIFLWLVKNGEFAIFFLHENLMFFPNTFSYGVFANIGSGSQERSGAGSEPRSEPRVPASSGGVPGQALNDRFRTTFRTTGSGKVLGQVPNHGFRGQGSAGTVPERFWPGF